MLSLNEMKKLLFFALASALLFSCRKDKFITDPSAKLAFSTDSILFDTVFTTVGSTTKNFLVYNHNSKPIKISTIRIARGSASNFRMNVDGNPVVETHDVEIAANDSMWVFVEVTVDPNNQNSPLVIRDSIVFETNGNIQDVDLEAWGQDAYFHVPNVFPTNGFPPYSVIPCNSVWMNDKPHVIYGLAVVDSACTLTIQAGTRVHLHKGGMLYVYRDGTLIVNGNAGQRVTFQGDRLEPDYADVPGQWAAIYFSPLCNSSKISYATIKNGTWGIRADSFPAVNPSVVADHTIIKNMSSIGVWGNGSKIRMSDCLVANCGLYTCALTIGGEYSFRHCTFADYWDYSQHNVRTTSQILLNNYYQDINSNYQYRNLDSAHFYNCIIYGSLDDEIKLDKGGSTNFVYRFDHSVIKTTISSGSFFSCVKNADPAFADETNLNYHIQSWSSARAKGDPAVGDKFPFDCDGFPRMVNADNDRYDCGAFTYH